MENIYQTETIFIVNNWHLLFPNKYKYESKYKF